ncbi:sel1 repeat family protein [Rhizobacter sp. AJA081-3]|uniref:tetratricopeptide repeat protein n=1 Tax=Rhizobacter sp. AJA081-3 TaxID=2753607 RepID=UPI001ADF92E0|nr:sel1 repeat family protein [Rhizobacter sp. AJA081-3]QTN25458.1 sel1 repeat family protein [Rhizobacter sp. AJA081-3]
MSGGLRPVVAAAVCAAVASPVSAAGLDPSEEAVRDLKQGRCEAVIESLNRGLKEGERRSYFLMGYIFYRGDCVKRDPARARPYLETAAKHGESAAAKLLVQMHGLGQGVAQSYVEAGRWTLAQTDISRLEAGKPAATPEQAKRESDVRYLQALGILSTVWASMQDKIVHPSRELEARTHANNAQLPVSMRVGPMGITYSFSSAPAEIETDLQTAVLRRSTAPYQERVQDAIAAAIVELPPFPTPEATAEIRSVIAFKSY